FLPRGFGGSFFRFLLHADSFCLRGFGLLASLFGFQATLRFSGGIGARFGFALLGCPFVRSNLCLRIFLSLLLHGHHAGFFGGLNNFAGGCLDSLLVALAAINLFGRAELLLGFGQRGSGIFIGKSNVRDAHGIARLEEFERGLAVDAEDGVLNLGVGRRIGSAAHQLVIGADVFDFGHGGYSVFRGPGGGRLRGGKIWLGGDERSGWLHGGAGVGFARVPL